VPRTRQDRGEPRAAKASVRASATALFAQIKQELAPSGRFVMADVVVPDSPDDAVTPLSTE
jgi:hypothetical protein